MGLRQLTHTLVLLLSLALIGIWWQASLSLEQALQFFPVFFVGIGGATIANATGVGGGVVFVPVFDYFNSAGLLPVSPIQIVATSFLIQCFGMTTGSITWLHNIQRSTEPHPSGVSQREFWLIIGTVLLSCLPMLLATQYLLAFVPTGVLFWFKSLSIGLGLALFVSVWRDDPALQPRRRLVKFDLLMLCVLGGIGGFATALFSVGVGELVALYLFIRNYPLVTCAASAVIITAVTVVSGMIFHYLNTDIPWALAAFAVPGAVIGGYLARRFAYFLGPHRLKIVAGVWIVGSSCYLLFVH